MLLPPIPVWAPGAVGAGVLTLKASQRLEAGSLLKILEDIMMTEWLRLFLEKLFD
jgi:hypothetical protein